MIYDSNHVWQVIRDNTLFHIESSSSLYRQDVLLTVVVADRPWFRREHVITARDLMMSRGTTLRDLLADMASRMIHSLCGEMHISRTFVGV